MPRIVDHEERRAELTAAAMDLVAVGGRDAASVRALARATGWSTGAVRHYVPSSAALETLLLEDVAARVQQRVADRVREGIAAHLPPVELAAGMLAEILPLDERRRAEHRVWVALYLAPDDAQETAWAWTGQLLFHRQLVLLLAGEPTVPDLPEQLAAPLERAARNLQAYADGLALRVAAGIQPPDEARDDLHAYLADLRRTIQPPEAASPER